ncbi:MAG: hypothetical protein IB616_04355 [Methanosarcinales archaeon]|nr:MAG: hypothetical protein IB616_04355 [Methanosarcinales archaeon]
MLSDRRKIIIIGVVMVMLFTSLTAYALFFGSHMMYTRKASPDYGSAEFCVKCHPDVVATVMVSAHNATGCICHGYDPEAGINLAHNLTKQIYCTNCHSNYDAEGNIIIHEGVSGLNQSGHYITNDTVTLYNNSQQFFGSS